jgi:transposase
VSELLQRAAAEGSGVPVLACQLLAMMARQLAALDAEVKRLEARLMAWHRADPVSQCLATQPGVGPIGAVSFALKVADQGRRSQGLSLRAPLCRLARDHAQGEFDRRATPAGKDQPPEPAPAKAGGDEGRRKLLVFGATARSRFAKAGHASPWLLNLLARKPNKLAAVALANQACPGEGRGWPASGGP